MNIFNLQVEHFKKVHVSSNKIKRFSRIILFASLNYILFIEYEINESFDIQKKKIRTI